VLDRIDPSGRERRFSVGHRHSAARRQQPQQPDEEVFRLKFRGKYGDTKLKYPLFPDTPVDEFNSLVLRADYNNSWVHSSQTLERARGSLVRDAFAKDAHGAMGDLALHSRYVHLYINGLYWGVYNSSEDPTTTSLRPILAATTANTTPSKLPPADCP